jgi:small subunit ribosomal protein S16
VAVKIKLKRLGKIRAPYYRIVVADARTKRDGRAIEEIGKYHPKAEPSFIEVNSDRAQHWLSVGAQPTDPVRKILEITGDWQKFKGLPGAEGTLKTAPPKEDRKEIFAAAVKETLGGATTTKSRGKSGGGKDADSAPDKSGRAEKADKAPKADKDAGSGRGGRQAKAKSGEPSGKAAAKSGGDAAAKPAEDTAAKPAKDTAAKPAKDTAAKPAKDTAAKPAKDAAKSEGAGDAAAADAASAKAPAAEATAADAPAADAPAADASGTDAAAGDAAEAKTEPAGADAESASGD